MHNPKVLEGLGLRIVRADGESISWEEFWQQDFYGYLYYWVRGEVKPEIYKVPDTHGRII